MARVRVVPVLATGKTVLLGDLGGNELEERGIDRVPVKVNIGDAETSPRVPARPAALWTRA